jgi:hypothetical protein
MNFRTWCINNATPKTVFHSLLSCCQLSSAISDLNLAALAASDCGNVAVAMYSVYTMYVRRWRRRPLRAGWLA